MKDKELKKWKKQHKKEQKLLRKRLRKQTLQKYDSKEFKRSFVDNIEVKFSPTLSDKFEVLDDYYLWLEEEERDANLAHSLIKYKQILRRREFLREKRDGKK